MLAMDKRPETHCRVCGYEPPSAPWGGDGRTPSFLRCPSCGVEWGLQDTTLSDVSRYRTAWREKGAPWVDPSVPHDGLGVPDRLRRLGVRRMREDHIVLENSGALVLLMQLDFAVTLETLNTSLRIESDFRLVSVAGTVHPICLSGAPSDLAPILYLSRDSVIAECRAYRDGRLAVLFDDGSRIEVDGGGRYEAWSFTTTDTHTAVVSMPGGSLQTFDETRSL